MSESLPKPLSAFYIISPVFLAEYTQQRKQILIYHVAPNEFTQNNERPVNGTRKKPVDKRHTWRKISSSVGWDFGGRSKQYVPKLSSVPCSICSDSFLSLSPAGSGPLRVIYGFVLRTYGNKLTLTNSCCTPAAYLARPSFSIFFRLYLWIVYCDVIYWWKVRRVIYTKDKESSSRGKLIFNFMLIKLQLLTYRTNKFVPLETKSISKSFFCF